MEILFFLIIISFACLLQGIVGFGFALVATPLCLIFLEKETVISSMLVVSVILNGFLTREIKEQVDFKLLIYLFLSSLLGMPLGVWVLKIVPTQQMRISVGSLAIFFTAFLYFSNFKLPTNNLLTVIAGFFSGLLNTSTSMSGPPVVLLFTNQVTTFQRVSFGLISIPFVLLAGFLGNRMAFKVSHKLLRLLVLSTVFLSGLYCVFLGSRWKC